MKLVNTFFTPFDVVAGFAMTFSNYIVLTTQLSGTNDAYTRLFAVGLYCIEEKRRVEMHRHVIVSVHDQ